MDRLRYKGFIFLFFVMLVDIVIYDCMANCELECDECYRTIGYPTETVEVQENYWCDCVMKVETWQKICIVKKYCEVTDECEDTGTTADLCQIVKTNTGRCSNCYYKSPSKSFSGQVSGSASDFISTNLETMNDASLGVVLRWPGSDLDLILYPPYGAKIEPTSINNSTSTYFKNATYEGYLIKNPIPGYWIFEVKPIEVGVNGENYTVSLYQFVNDSTHPTTSDSRHKNLSAYPNTPTNKTILSNMYSDGGIDTNGNGKFDFLAINIGISVSEPGHYTLLGDIYDSNGDKIVWSIGGGSFEVGNQTIALDFDGKAISRHGTNGPYHLEKLVLQSGSSDTNWTLCNALGYAYTTKFYNYSDFEG